MEITVNLFIISQEREFQPVETRLKNKFTAIFILLEYVL